MFEATRAATVSIYFARPKVTHLNVATFRQNVGLLSTRQHGGEHGERVREGVGKEFVPAGKVAIVVREVTPE